MPILQEPIPVGMIVCNEEIDMTEQEIRAMRVAEAVHSARMEGGVVASSFFADARDYIEEQIDAHELVNSTRRRYGLESV
ncbi:Hypothetical protein RY67_2002 [Bifidobacterium longum subsp. infantis]|uniref:Antitoxin VbhA domain-containing protein n=2 Tax=Bifidobacterium longum TaxID=216816 RepID=A0A0M4LWC4_BIFLI|nr:Hypothetical protein RY67_2002 [Bifidobacterium longum subsp. infantis]